MLARWRIWAVVFGFAVLTAGEVGLFLWLNGPEIARRRAGAVRGQRHAAGSISPQAGEHSTSRAPEGVEPAAPLRAVGDMPGAPEQYTVGRPAASDEPRARLGAASRLVERGRFSEASELYERHLARWPDDRAARLRLAEALVAIRAFDRAATAYRIALGQVPDDDETRLKLARVLSWSKRYGESIEEYRRVLGDR
jgi:tetratricopeptide (TPR) repeat protein